tara:strand:+ start:3537 stop:4193 length:657 start_codon:yes stop_codon:yes gene_type:complete
MALLTSGYLSLAGNTAGRSVAKELNLGTAGVHTPTISLGQTNVRALAQRTSGSVAASHLRGKSSTLWNVSIAGSFTRTVTLIKSTTIIPVKGYVRASTGITSGGTTSDTTVDFLSGATLDNLSSEQFVTTKIYFTVLGTYPNSGFNTMTINGKVFSRTTTTSDSNSVYDWGIPSHENTTSLTGGSITRWMWSHFHLDSDYMVPGPFNQNGSANTVVFN